MEKLSRSVASKRVLYNTAIDVIVEEECHDGTPCRHDVILAMRDGRNIPIMEVTAPDIRTMLIRLRKTVPDHFETRKVKP